MVHNNLEKYQSFNQQSDFYNGQPRGGDPVTSYMDVYKANIQSDGSLEKLKWRILVRGDLKNKENIGDTWDPTAPMRTLKYLLADAASHKSIFNQLDFIGLFLQSNVKYIAFAKLDSRYG